MQGAAPPKNRKERRALAQAAKAAASVAVCGAPHAAAAQMDLKRSAAEGPGDITTPKNRKERRMLAQQQQQQQQQQGGGAEANPWAKTGAAGSTTQSSGEWPPPQQCGAVHVALTSRL
jgi:hypothetical protein